jgi:hypothetical protein
VLARELGGAQEWQRLGWLWRAPGEWARRHRSQGESRSGAWCGLAGTGLGSAALGGRNMGARLGRHEADARTEASWRGGSCAEQAT